MTTLPSTTSIRLPRVGGPGGQLPGPQLPPSGGVPAAPAASGMTGSDIWRVLRRNLWIIVGLLVLSAVGGVLLNYWLLKNHPRFTTPALVQVVNERVYDPDGKMDRMSGDYAVELPVQLKTQAALLMAPTLWSEVISKNDAIRRTTWYKEFELQAAAAAAQQAQGQSFAGRFLGQTAPSAPELALESLESDFAAVPREGQQLIQISMSTADRADGKVIIEEIVKAHIDAQQAITRARLDSDYRKALAERNRHETTIRTYQNQLANLTRTLSLAATTGNETSDVSAVKIQLSTLILKGLEAESDANVAIAQLTSTEETIKQGNEPAAVDQAIDKDPDIYRIKAEKLSVELDIAEANDTKSTTATPRLEALKRRLKVLEDKLAERTDEVKIRSRDQYVQLLKGEAAAAKATSDKINATIEQIKANLAELSATLQAKAQLEGDLQLTRTMQKEAAERVAAIDATMGTPSSGIKWAAMPATPDRLSFPRLRNILPLTMLVGLALGLGIAFSREILDTSVKSPRDIARVGQLNLLGMIPAEQDDPQLNGVPLHTAISAAPLSAIAEQFRQVRTRLQHSASLDTTRTIVITSPGPKDGKTTVACNLAAGLALNGRRILLVDANFRRAELHKLYNVSNDTGFSNVLDSVNNLETAVKPTNVANLDVLPTGPKPANPTELIESPLFSDFIDRALEEYDHVIFDAGPLLVVSEAVAMAPRVDGVVSVVRARANSRGILGRLRDTLKQTKAENLGVILNGVRSLKGGYYRRNIKTYYAYQNEK